MIEELVSELMVWCKIVDSVDVCSSGFESRLACAEEVVVESLKPATKSRPERFGLLRSGPVVAMGFEQLKSA